MIFRHLYLRLRKRIGKSNFFFWFGVNAKLSNIFTHFTTTKFQSNEGKQTKKHATKMYPTRALAWVSFDGKSLAFFARNNVCSGIQWSSATLIWTTYSMHGVSIERIEFARENSISALSAAHRNFVINHFSSKYNCCTRNAFSLEEISNRVAPIKSA